MDDQCDFRFGLWRDETSTDLGDQVGALQTVSNVDVNNGSFITTINFGEGAIDGAARWLAIEVCCSNPCAPGALVMLAPRAELKPVPHALALPGLYTTQEPASAAGITPPPKTKIHVSGSEVISYDPTVGEAVFQTVNGVRAGSVKIDGSLASNVAGPGSSAELVITGDVLALQVDGDIVDRWTGLGASQFGDTPNRISGSPLNSVAAGIYGAVISGGGVGGLPPYINQVTADLGTIGGGQGNTAGGNGSTVGGGSENTASGHVSTICGGSNNIASGLYSTVGGGIQNTASAQNSTTPGGEFNEAGGNYSFAAGRRAKANHLGAFVWADVTDADFTSTGSNQFLIRASGGVGIGTTSPDSDLVIGGVGGVDGAKMLGFGESATASQFWFESGFAGSDAANFMSLSTNVGSLGDIMTWTAGGRVGIGTAAPTTTLEVRESSLPGGWPVLITSNLNAGIQLDTDGTSSSWAIYHDAGDSLAFRDSTTGANRMLIDGGAGTVSMISTAATVAVINRLTNDGTLISLQQASTEEGTISVSGTTVSYNAFTGSHYGWTNERIERGTLVSLTGDNRRRTQDPGAEPTYGIAPSNKANDSKCLGAYLGLLEPSKAAAMENPHQVMAVGNGDMWVVDTGRNIEPGQYLISSDLNGHAMLDDAERFAVGYVVARAGEPVDWSQVADTIDGRKHKRISVFFESFERGNAVGLGKIVEQQQARIEALERAGAGSVVRAGLPLALVAVVGLVALRRRSANGGGR